MHDIIMSPWVLGPVAVAIAWYFQRDKED